MGRVPVDARDGGDRTALHLTSDTLVATALLASGASVDSLDKESLKPQSSKKNSHVILAHTNRTGSHHFITP